MTLKRIKYSVVFVVMFFSFVNLACAGLEITEINNPDVKANHCWIKVYNNSSTEVNLTEWFVVDDDGIIPPKPWHYHSINADGPSILAPNSYAIIADSTFKTIDVFKSKNSEISNPLFYGSLTFVDEGTMGLSKDKKTIIGQMSYSGISTSSSNNSLDNSTDNPVDETVDSIPVKNNTPIIYKITTKIIAPKIVTAGVPFNIDHTTTGLNKEKIILGKFVWNFGDGMQKQLSVSDPFSYVYDYPGEYVISLSYYDSVFSIKPDAIDRVTIKVIPSGINIIGVGTLADPYIEIENNSSYEMSLNKWILKGSVHSFMIPEGTVILPNKKLKLSPKITGFDFDDLSSISIIDQSGQIFATYPKQKIYQDVSLIKYSVSKSPQENVIKSDSVTNNQIEDIANSPDVINLNDLGANAINSNDLNNLSKGFYAWLGLIIIIIVGIISIIIIRRKKEYPDYIEEKITANDMKIIE